MLNMSSKSRHPCLDPDLKRNTFRFPPLSVVAVGFSYMVFTMLKYGSSVATLLRIFIINGCWFFVLLVICIYLTCNYIKYFFMCLLALWISLMRASVEAFIHFLLFEGFLSGYLFFILCVSISIVTYIYMPHIIYVIICILYIHIMQETFLNLCLVSSLFIFVSYKGNWFDYWKVLGYNWFQAWLNPGAKINYVDEFCFQYLAIDLPVFTIFLGRISLFIVGPRRFKPLSFQVEFSGSWEWWSFGTISIWLLQLKLID